MSNRYVLGLDPGKSGAYCLLSLDNDEPLQFLTVPSIGNNVNVPALLATVRGWAESHKIVAAAMEDVHAIFGSAAKSTFQFGWINGVMEASLYAAGVPFTKVQPKAWQTVGWAGIEKIQINTGKKTSTGKPKFKTDTKATSLLAVSRLFPTETFLATARSKKPHDGYVDAALLAHYASLKLAAW
jgi:hypothetical protein